jgi:hypothetical protein
MVKLCVCWAGMLQHHDEHVLRRILRFSAASSAADGAPEALAALVMVTLLSAGMMINFEGL